MKICKQCNIEYEDNMKFCPECGTKLENVRNTCPNCGTEYNEGQKFCSECGTKLFVSNTEQMAHYSSQQIESIFQDGKKYFEKGYEGTDDPNMCKAFECFMVAAQAGHADAQSYLGYMYEFGYGINKDSTKSSEWYSKAFESFKKATERGDVKSMVGLGYCYRVGDGVEQDEKKAVELFETAYKKGYIPAAVNLGECYEQGCGVEEDYVKAIEWYTKAAEAGETSALVDLGDCYRDGGNGIEEDYVKAIEWYTKAAEAGETYALVNIGSCYKRGGNGIEQDCVKAIEWYTKAAEAGETSALVDIGRCYQYGGKGIEKDCVKAIEWYTKAAEAGEKDAFIKLGDYYFNLKDFTKAYYFYKHAADKGDHDAQELYNPDGTLTEDVLTFLSLIQDAESGNVDAQYQLAQRYESGKGMLQWNKEEAIKWYEKAAEAGHVDAVYKCWDYYYYYDDEEDEEYTKYINAKKWLINAADSGNVEACNKVAMLYLRGEYGFEKNPSLAIKFFMAGVEKGNLDSIYNVGETYYTHSEELGVSKRLGREWLEKAAIAGHAESQFRLGWIYSLSPHDDYSRITSFTWYKKAAEQGHKEAQYQLAQHYVNGSGVTKDLYAACKWYEKAAEGSSDAMYGSIDFIYDFEKQNAQYNVGCYYYYGKGVMRDLDKAEKWFSKAAEDGHEESKKMLEKVKEEKAYYTEGASTNANSVNNFAIDRCVPHVFYIKVISIDITMPEGNRKTVICGNNGNFSGWTGTGMLLNDGRFVTARHVVEPWNFCMSGGEADETQLSLNIIANNGGKVIARFVAISSTGVQISFTSDQCTINRWNDKTTLVKDGKIVVIAPLDNTDYAYFRSGRSEGLPFNTMLSTNLLRGTKLEVLGFPLGLGANSATDINPIYGSGIVAVNGLQNGVILTTDTNYEQGNSGGPVFKANVNGVLEVIGLVSAGAGRVTGFIVPIAAVK